MVWINHADKGTVWKLQYDMRNSLDGKLRLMNTYTVNPVGTNTARGFDLAAVEGNCTFGRSRHNSMLEPVEPQLMC